MLTGAAQIFAFGGSIYLARSLQLEKYGYFLYALSWATLVAQIATLGFDRLAVREVARAIADRRSYSIKSLVSRLYRCVILVACCATIACIACAIYMVQSGQLVGYYLAAAFCTTPLIALLSVQMGVIRGLGEIVRSQIPEKLIRPFVFLAVSAISLPLIKGSEVGVVIGATWVSYLVAVVCAGRLVAVITPTPAPSPGLLCHSPLWQSSMHIGAVVALQALSARLEPLLIGSVFGPSDLAVFMVATRASQSVVIILSVFNVLMGPDFARLHALRDMNAMTALVRRYSYSILCCAIGTALPLLIWRESVMALFGDGYAHGGQALAVLCAAQLISAASGPAGSLLVYCGLESQASRAILASTIGGGIASCILVPRYGATGGAVGICVGAVIKSLLLSAACWRKLKIDPTILARTFSK